MITVHEFLQMALDNTFEFCIYDFSKERNIFENWHNKEMPVEMENLIVSSWNINNGRLELNVDGRVEII